MYKKLIAIGIGSVFVSIGINVFILPLQLVTGGITGISLIINYLLGYKVGVMIFCLNLPIYLLALGFNRSYFLNAIYGMVLSAVMIDLLFPLHGIFHLPIILSACLGGVFNGIGTGIMLRQHASQGGVDLFSLILAKWLSLNPGIIILVIDASIIISGILLLQNDTAIYSLFVVVCSGIVTSLITSFKRIIVYV